MTVIYYNYANAIYKLLQKNANLPFGNCIVITLEYNRKS